MVKDNKILLCCYSDVLLLFIWHGEKLQRTLQMNKVHIPVPVSNSERNYFFSENI